MCTHFYRLGLYMSLHIYIYIYVIDKTLFFVVHQQSQPKPRAWFCPDIFWSQVILYVPWLTKCMTEEILTQLCDFPIVYWRIGHEIIFFKILRTVLHKWSSFCKGFLSLTTELSFHLWIKWINPLKLFLSLHRELWHELILLPFLDQWGQHLSILREYQ